MTVNTETEQAHSTSFKKEIFIGAAVLVGLLAIVGLIVLGVHNSGPKIDYQPVAACTYFSGPEALELLGDKTISTNNDSPVISGDMATSKCGYADGNADTNKLLVAAIIVRSGINDKGVEKNITEFTNGTPTNNVEVVKDVGDKAYFNQVNGQLNVLKGHDWFILTNGFGSSPEANTMDDAVKLAKLVLN